MTGDETRFYLREIHSYWTTAHISSEKARELQRENLIEISTELPNTVRLTLEGARAKAANRPSEPTRVFSRYMQRRPIHKRKGVAPAVLCSFGPGTFPNRHES